jgi:hypothetical protein
MHVPDGILQALPQRLPPSRPSWDGAGLSWRQGLSVAVQGGGPKAAWQLAPGTRFDSSSVAPWPSRQQQSSRHQGDWQQLRQGEAGKRVTAAAPGRLVGPQGSRGCVQKHCMDTGLALQQDC